MNNYYNIEHTVDLVINDISKGKVELKTILCGLLFNVNHFISDSPNLICLGGVPGVGKSTYSKKCYEDNYFIINPDNYRKLHPNYLSLNTGNLISETNEFSSQISELLFKILTSLSCNIVIECTFANYNYWQNFLQRNSAYVSRYYRTLIFLSAPLEICYQAMCFRYKTEVQNMTELIPRPVKREFLFDRVKKIEQSVIKYCFSNLFDKILFLHKHTMCSDFVQISYDDYLAIINEYKATQYEII